MKNRLIPPSLTPLNWVASDAIQDDRRGLVYAARVRLARHPVQVEGVGTVNLSPGMAVTVEIKTGKRRVIEYGLRPLIQ